jgi:hypothetical protein
MSPATQRRFDGNRALTIKYGLLGDTGGHCERRARTARAMVSEATDGASQESARAGGARDAGPSVQDPRMGPTRAH